MNLEVEIQGQAGITDIKKKKTWASTLFLQTILKSFVYIIHPTPKFQPQIPLKINKLTNAANVKERKAAPCELPEMDSRLPLSSAEDTM